MQVLKSTADVEGGRALYDGYSTVSDSGAHNFLRLRETVLLRKEARKMFVQANTRVSGEYLHPYLLMFGVEAVVDSCTYLFLVWFPGDSVELVEYEGSAAGLIQSFTERFQDEAEQLEADLLEMNRRDAPCWCWWTDDLLQRLQ